MLGMAWISSCYLHREMSREYERKVVQICSYKNMEMGQQWKDYNPDILDLVFVWENIMLYQEWEAQLRDY